MSDDPTGPPDWTLLDDADAVREAMPSLESVSLVGLDTETYRDPQGRVSRVSLVQIASGDAQVRVIDTLAVGVEAVRPLVESASLVMAAHNARFDEMVLAGEGLRPAAFVDTLSMARMALELPSYSLASVAEHLLGLPLDKTLQRSNWRRRPLTRQQIEYAALDAHVTLKVYAELERHLREQGMLKEALRRATLSARDPTSKSVRKKRQPSAPPIQLTAEEKLIVAHLKRWRLRCANERHLPAYMVCPDRTLDQLARTRPQTLESLAGIFGLGAAKIERYGAELLKALGEAEKNS
ncbi:MAG: HRDC domain-containing protein [Pyrinomonadaceae bacterium]